MNTLTAALTDSVTPQGRATLSPVQVEAIDGPGAGAKVALRSGTVIIGSSPDCDLVVDDSKVSRHHVSAELLHGMVRVKDLGSRNGTLYLGARIDSARVPTGGTVTIGKTTLRFAPLEGASAPESGRTELYGMLGASRPMRRLFATIERLGPLDSTVLIRGETGSGKDAVARALTASSPRAQGRFVVFDCAAVQAGLVESELFGHARGAFTHAEHARIGALEYAAGGTLFFDEIGELPLELQPKLLRALESRELRPVGASEARQIDVRIIAATHKDLEAEVAGGRFRADLYFRLAVAVVDVPPLRDRPEDIPLLARHFAERCGGPGARLDATALAALQCERWPGNVRELRNAVERLVRLGDPSPRAPAQGPVGFKRAREWLVQQFERDWLLEALKRHDGNFSAAARESGLSRSQFYRLLWQHGLAERDGAEAKAT